MAQRPLVATADVAGPFEVLKRTLTLQPKLAKPPASGDQTRSPVAWWKLDETGGQEAADASGHHLAARVQGKARWIPAGGRLNGAVDLNGAQNFVECGHTGEFDFRDGLTVSLWLKPRGGKKTAQTLVAKGSDTWRLYSEGEKRQLVFALNGPQTAGKDRNKLPRVTSTRAMEDGQWHHVAGVYDGRRVALYLDGALASSVTATGPLALNTEPVWLGNNSAAREECFDGSMDDVRLYACGLSEDEIKALYRDSTK